MNVAYNVDCLDGMKSLEDFCIDLTVTSPPYDNIRDYNGFSFDWRKTIKELHRITKNGGVVVWIVNDQTVDGSETGTSFKQALFAMECGFNLHDTMIWKKVSPFQHKNRYIASFEYMFVFSKGIPKTANIIADRINIHGGEKITSTQREKDGSTRLCASAKKGKSVKEFGARLNVWEVIPDFANANWHPATFPYKLACDHIISWSNEGDTVLDPFLGSGTTRLAAYDMKRDFIGYEISKEYFDKQEERFAQHTAQLSLFV